MKRGLLITAAMVFISSAVFAYNPPVNGESFTELSSARAISGSLSVCGGGIFYANPSSIFVNPALTYNQQRIGLNLGYTALFSSDKNDSSTFGSALQAGLVIPTKWTVFTFLLNGVFVPFESMNVNNSINLKVNLAKEITDKLCVGMNVYSGLFWGADNDWALGADLGFMYDVGELGFFKDFKYAASFLNMGKNFQKTTSLGINPNEPVDSFPTILSVKVGVSGLIVSTDSFKFGFAFDVTSPLLHNFIFDLGLECSIKDIVFINIGEHYNLAENVSGIHSFIPSIGISCRFSFGIKNNEYMEKNGWSESELSSYVAYRQFNGDINAVSMECDLNLGEEDTTPPVITLWLDDEGDE